MALAGGGGGLPTRWPGAALAPRLLELSWVPMWVPAAPSFQNFQEVTLAYLQGIAHSYNVSSVRAQFQSLAAESRMVALVANQTQAAVQGGLAHLKAWMRKTQHRSQKAEARLQALDLALSQKSQRQAQESEEQREAAANTGPRLSQLVHGHGARLAALEGWLQKAQPKLPSPDSLKLQRDRQALTATPEHGNPPRGFTARLQGTREHPAPGGHLAPGGTAAPRDPAQQAQPRQGPGEICDVGPVLIFPNASTENVVFLSPGFLKALRALSFCSWVRTSSGHLGTLLSYATEGNDNKLVLHGRASLTPGSVHFVIGDPAFRELPLQSVLDGQWHHVCVIWTSIQGRYWTHVDRRLVATGSRFREGYEIPPGGSLVLGQEQDSVGGGFDSSEAFVGSVSGFAIWDRALVPAEVANLATGRGFPAGAVLTLANATSVGGFVQRANCTCLQRCPQGAM
ncbi:Pentraxin-4 [Tupaia chinensis]|uniref:Pentraxin-4 n=1 Tax=Tupaia chinensis TaxID=246437 RepID=L9KXW4_TUPCH|nr:Pentraxin-4 [Tupaia chinensis]